MRHQLKIAAIAFLLLGIVGAQARILDYGFARRLTAPASVTSDATNFTSLTDLSVPLDAGISYTFEIFLFSNDSGGGGTKFDLNGGSATMTAILCDVTSRDLATTAVATTRTVALSTATGYAASTSEREIVERCTITVNAAGTLIPRFTQNSSNASATTILAGSYIKILRTTN